MTETAVGTRAEVWVNQIEKAAEDDDNQFFGHVAETLGCYLDNAHEWESGEFEFTDLPHFDREVKWVIDRSVLVGTAIAADRATLYLVTDDQGTFVGLYGHVENAQDRASEHPALEYETASPTAPDAESYLDPLREASGTAPRAVAENLGCLVDNWDDALDGEIRPADLPRLDAQMRRLTFYAVLFGVLWEYSYPGLVAVFDGERIDELHHGRGSAEERADELGERAYVQRVTVADGDLGPSDVFDDLSEVV